MAVAFTAVAWLGGCSANRPTDPGAPSAPPASSAAASESPAPSAAAAPTGADGTSPSAAQTQAPRTENWTALEAGDCLAELPPTDPAVVTVTLVDCSQTHLAETYLRAPVPVDAALDGTASTRCEAGFVQYTGRASAGSPYTTTYLIDSDQDRTYNNPLPSTVICLLQGAQGQSLTGSARR
ncbi:MAG: hypothetical protein ACKOQ4_16065 [Mycobacterium sp.]